MQAPGGRRACLPQSPPSSFSSTAEPPFALSPSVERCEADAPANDVTAAAAEPTNPSARPVPLLLRRRAASE